ncbi:MAG: glycosyltransferase [Desulfobulbia bacterium]
MSRVLLAWELGENYGHLSTLLPLARMLRQRKHEPIFVVRDLAVASVLLGKEFSFLQAPLPSESNRQSRVPVSYADILSGRGFGKRDVLAGILHAWQVLFDLVKPEMVVAQFAPTAIVAARQASIPSLQMDTGFECPPEVRPYPCFRPWMKITREALLEREDALLQTINVVCGWRSEDLRTALRADLSLLITLQELDHYSGRRGGRYIGPIFSHNTGEKFAWQHTTGKRVFVYLRPFPELRALLAELRQSRAEVIAVIPGIDRELADSFSSEQFRIISQQVRLETLLSQADLVVSHGGHGLTSAFLLQGVPLLVFPIMIEQWMTARNLERMKTGLRVSREALRKHGCASALSDLLTDPLYSERAAAVAAKYRSYDQNKTIDRLALTVEQMTAGIQNHQARAH